MNKWYFDELFDVAIVRPDGRGRALRAHRGGEPFVQGVLVGGTVGIVRAGTSFARSIQTGELRALRAAAAGRRERACSSTS